MDNVIICPFHKVSGESEKTPSCHVYSDGFYCFSCGASGPVSDLTGVTPPKPKKPVNLEGKLRYIQSLPVGEIRGLSLPHDKDFYYLVWPDGKFYLARAKQEGRAKYLVPAGHSRPLYKPRIANTGVLWFVEGEINAASLAKVVEDTVISPGSVTKFAIKDLTMFRRYGTIYLVVDNDIPGTMAAIELFGRLKTFKANVQIQLWKDDANKVLMERGIDGLRQEVARQTSKA